MRTTAEPEGFSAFPPAALRLWRCASVFGNTLLAAMITTTCCGILIDWHLSWALLTTILVAVGCLAGIEVMWLLPRRYRHACWRLSGGGLEVRRGAIVRRERLYPISAILFVEQRSNPLTRHFGLVSTHVHDITGTHDVGQLTETEAHEIIRFVAQNQCGSEKIRGITEPSQA